MSTLTLTDSTLEVELHGLRRLWSLKRRLRVPLRQVRGATLDPGVMTERRGLRAPGLRVPGLASIGSFRRDGEWTFWEVTAHDTPVVVELSGHRYSRLVLDVDEPRQVVDRVNAAVGGQAP